jgi:hypothetical protein
MNQIMMIKPYLWEGEWVFDDPSRDLDKELLVGGMPEIIEAACQANAIENFRENGFKAIFSDASFPGATHTLEHLRADEGSGNWYRLLEHDLEGWLCPALLKYFERPPARIYVQLKEAV